MNGYLNIRLWRCITPPFNVWMYILYFQKGSECNELLKGSQRKKEQTANHIPDIGKIVYQQHKSYISRFMKLFEMFINLQKHHICQNIEIILFSQKLTQINTKFTHTYTEYPRYAENQI